MNTVLELERFQKTYEKLDADMQSWVDNMIEQSRTSLRVGDPITHSYFREKKYGNKRLYFFVNRDSEKALLVTIGTKKEQRDIIKHCLENQEQYLQLIQ